MSDRDIDPVSRLAKLNTTDDYILWKRRVFAYIRRYDAELLGFEIAPLNNSSSAHKKWFECMTKAKSTIILCLGDSPLAKVRMLVDDDEVTAKALWDEIEKIYTSSNAQSILNIRQELDDLRFEEGKSWDSHVNKFTELLSKLATYDEELTDKEKASKLLRTLPDAFSGFAMIAQVQDLELERLIQAMHAEISRRASLRTSTRNNHDSGLISANVSKSSKKDKKNKALTGRISKQSTGLCYVCGKPGHFARDCWHRSNGLTSRGRGRGRGGSFRGGRGRGRGRGRFYPSYSSHDQNGSNYHNGNTFQGYGYPPNWQSGANNGTNHHTGMNQDTPTSMNQHPPPQANQHFFGNPTPPSNFDGNVPFRGFMAQVKRSKLASIDLKKTNDALIDSGATHCFFHSTKYFTTYRKIKEENVHSASGVSRIVGVGKVLIPVQGGIYFEAFHFPEFGDNILSVSKLSRFFTIEFATDEFGDQSNCRLISKESGKLVFKSSEVDGLYKMSIPKLKPEPSPSDDIQSLSETSSNNVACIVCSSTTVHNYQPTPILHDNKPMQWHFRTGHPSSTRYFKLSQTFPDVPFFPRSILDQMFCVPCQQGKTRRAPVFPTQSTVRMPLELVHTDISGPVLPSLSGSIYSLSFMDSKTAKSDVFFLKKKSELPNFLMKYKASSELQTGCRMQKIRLDGAGENMSRTVEHFCIQNGISLDPAPPYGHQSNGTAERLIQELWARTRVLLFASQLPASLWAEAMNHANWLRNRLPSSRINNQIPILQWNSHTPIHFSKVPVFGQPGFAFKYRSDTVPNKKFLARSVHAHFVGMQSDITILRVYIPETKSIMLTRNQDFRPYSNEKLPGVASILDGLARQSAIEGIQEEDGQAEDALMQAFHVFASSLLPPYPSGKPTNQSLLRSIKSDPRVPSSFRKAVLHPSWRAAIDREYQSLRDRETWEYVQQTPDMTPVPFTWVFRLKPLDNDGNTFLHKARCVIRGDKQKAYIDFDPNNVYAPVACHEAIRILLAYATANNLEMEGADISNAYLYGKVDVPIIMQQPTDSSGKQERPGMVCRLLKSLYGLRQAGEIWGSLFCNTLLSWGFQVSNVDKRMFFLVTAQQFVIILVVVDDMMFVSNSPLLLSKLKQQLSSTFDVKLFGRLQNFIGWEIRYVPDGIKITQTRYAKDVLSRCGLHSCNAAWSPLPTDADLTSCHEGDNPLNQNAHSEFRSMIGALIHLSVCTRPDISFAVCSLARHVHNPTERHQSLLKRILRYIAGTVGYGLHYKRGPLNKNSLTGHVDADWGGCTESRHSTTGYIIAINGGPVCWKSQKQTIIALSSAESEYVAMSSCAKQITWLRRLFWEIGMKKPFDTDDSTCMSPTFLHSDSTAAIALAKSDTVAARNKHIEIKIHHLKNLWKRNIIHLLYVPSAKNVADILTKPVAFKTLKDLAAILRL